MPKPFGLEVKPTAMNNPKENAGGKISRRRFFNWIWAGLGLIAVGEMAWAIISFIRPLPARKSEPDENSLITAGPAEKFTRETVTAFPRGGFYLVRLEDGGFLALSRKCTHLGCTVPWITEEKRFVCPCHASIFDMRGAVIQSPAPRALDLFPVKIENGIVRVDIRHSVRRTGFTSDQPVYAIRSSLKTHQTQQAQKVQ
jgi:cytochrome b6-f complex iron-sulfur subunit